MTDKEMNKTEGLNNPVEEVGKMMLSVDHKEEVKEDCEEESSLVNDVSKLTKEELELLFNPDRTKLNNKLKRLSFLIFNNLSTEIILAPKGYKLLPLEDAYGIGLENEDKQYVNLHRSKLNVKVVNGENHHALTLHDTIMNVKEEVKVIGKDSHIVNIYDSNFNLNYLYLADVERINGLQAKANRLTIEKSDISGVRINGNEDGSNSQIVKSNLIGVYIGLWNRSHIVLNNAVLKNNSIDLYDINLTLNNITEFPDDIKIYGNEDVSCRHYLPLNGNDSVLYYDDVKLTGQLFVGISEKKAIFMSFHSYRSDGWRKAIGLIGINELSKDKLIQVISEAVNYNSCYVGELSFPSRVKMIEEVAKDILKRFISFQESRLEENYVNLKRISN